MGDFQGLNSIENQFNFSTLGYIPKFEKSPGMMLG